MGKEIGEVYGDLVAQKEKMPDTIDTVWKAAAYGDTDVLKELLEADAAAANQADPSGYRPLHVRKVRPVCRAAPRPTWWTKTRHGCGRAIRVQPVDAPRPRGRTRVLALRAMCGGGDRRSGQRSTTGWLR